MDTSPNSSETPAAPDAQPLVYEETPILQPIHEPTTPVHTSSENQLPDPLSRPELPERAPHLPRGAKRSGKIVRDFLIFIILFGLGIGASLFLRHLLPNGVGTSEVSDEPVALDLVPTEVVDPFYSWVPYPLTYGTSKKPVRDVIFRLPPGSNQLMCDGESGCLSQGMYLPGGTRFTVAVRGSGSGLSDFRNTILTDARGKEFVMRPVVISGHEAVEYTGDFVGTTISGYTFSKMRGVMIPVTETLSLELNHFSPSTSNVEFEADDILFDQITQALVFHDVVATPSPVLEDQPNPTP